MANLNLNPYNGNINPSINHGLKLFLKSTKEHKEDTKLKFSQSNEKSITSAFESGACKFEWSTLVNVVPSNGTRKNIKFIPKNFSDVTFKQVKK